MFENETLIDDSASVSLALYTSFSRKNAQMEKMYLRCIQFIWFHSKFMYSNIQCSFLLKTVSVNFEESLYTLMQICPFISVVNVTITAFFLRNRIGEMFEKLFNIYETGKCFFDHENMNVRISTKFVFLKRKTMIHSDFSWKRMIKVNGFYVSM